MFGRKFRLRSKRNNVKNAFPVPRFSLGMSRCTIEPGVADWITTNAPNPLPKLYHMSTKKYESGGIATPKHDQYGSRLYQLMKVAVTPLLFLSLAMTVRGAPTPTPACPGDIWTDISTASAPGGRDRHTAVWTGSEMIVWVELAGPARRTPAVDIIPVTDGWTTTSTTNAPVGRYVHTAVWTGSAMIVWGGGSGSQSGLNTGGRYKSGDRQLDNHHHDQRAFCAIVSHGGLDGQQDDRLGWSLSGWS